MSNFIIVLTSLELGGAERQAINFADYLIGNGHHVEVIGFSNPGRIVKICKEKGISCKLIKDERSKLLKKILRAINTVLCRNNEVENYKYLSKLVAKYIRDNGISYCISYCSPANTYACYAKKYYAECSYTWYQRDDGLCYEPIEIRDEAIHLADHVLSNGFSGYKWILENHSIESKIIYNGVFYTPPKKESDEWRKELKIDRDKTVCTMIAHFSKVKKNHYQNVNVFKKLVEDGYINFIMLFAGRPDDSEYYQEIKAFVRKNSLDSYVFFLNEVEDVSGLLSITDICFFGTNREGNPNGIIEATFAGLPIVASDLPEIREVVSEENYEYLFANGDYDKAERSLLELSERKELRMKIGEMNKAKAEKLFSSENNFKKLMTYIQNN